jgi:topoisomerase-4 subunit A
MATSIPSHNVAEIIDATLMLIDNPHAEHAALMEVFHGPDFHRRHRGGQPGGDFARL